MSWTMVTRWVSFHLWAVANLTVQKTPGSWQEPGVTSPHTADPHFGLGSIHAAIPLVYRGAKCYPLADAALHNLLWPSTKN